MSHDCAICGRDTHGDIQYRVGRHLYHWRCFMDREYAPAFKELFKPKREIAQRPGPKELHPEHERKIKAIR